MILHARPLYVILLDIWNWNPNEPRIHCLDNIWQPLIRGADQLRRRTSKLSLPTGFLGIDSSQAPEAEFRKSLQINVTF